LTTRYFDARERLSDALYAIPLMTRDRDRDSICNELRRRGLQVAAPTAVTTRLQCTQILDDVLARVGALQELARLLMKYDESDFSAEFELTVNELLPELYLTLQEKAHVVNSLHGQCQSGNLGRYYRAVVKRDPVEKIHDVEELVFRVHQDARHTGLDPLIHIIALTAKDARDPAVISEYIKYAEDYAQRADKITSARGVHASQVAQLRRVLDASERGHGTLEDRSAYIVLRLDPWNPRPLDHFLLTSWLYCGDELVRKFDVGDKPLKLTEVKLEAIRVINGALEIAEQRESARSSPVIEFILPRNQMNLAVESWSIEEEDDLPLGMQFVVVIRDLYRQKTASQRAAWRERWERVGDGSAPSEEVITRWIACADQPFARGELYRDLRRSDVTGAGLTFPPESRIHEFRLGEMLNTGMPIAVWPHSCCHVLTGSTRQDGDEGLAFKEQLCRLSSGHPIRELPQIVQKLRLDITRFGDVTSGVALLWDDPRRIVRPPDYELSTPTEQETLSE
jgi:hypothetical protein